MPIRLEDYVELPSEGNIIKLRWWNFPLFKMKVARFFNNTKSGIGEFDYYKEDGHYLSRGGPCFFEGFNGYVLKWSRPVSYHGSSRITFPVKTEFHLPPNRSSEYAILNGNGYDGLYISADNPHYKPDHGVVKYTGNVFVRRSRHA